jgi:hypothetical protein
VGTHGWNEHDGTVTGSFDDWRLAITDLQSYVRLGLRFGQESYDRIWNEVNIRPTDGSTEFVDELNDVIEGIWPEDYRWRFLSGAYRDMVTAFEAYLEDAMVEILREHNRPTGSLAEFSAQWWELVKFYRVAFGHDLETPAVRQIRKRRHILVHRAGELRTDQLRKEFGSQDEFLSRTANLNVELLQEACSLLRVVATNIDQQAHGVIWGERRRIEVVTDGSAFSRSADSIN